MAGRYGFGFTALIVAILLAALPEPPARAQDDWDAEDPAMAQPAAIGQQADFEVAEEAFDQWVFNGKTSSQVTKRLDSLLTLRVESVERACGLSEDQKKKLQLAGRGDVKRYFDSVEEVRKKFRQVRRDRNKINQIWQDIQPLQAEFNSGLFDEKSLFHKILQRTLDPDQSAFYEQQERQRRKFRYEAKVQQVVAMLENGIPLRDEQRQKFIALLLDQPEPPRKFGQYNYYVVLYYAARLPEEKLKPIFDEAQWRALKQLLEQAKAMEALLKRSGLIP